MRSLGLGLEKSLIFVTDISYVIWVFFFLPKLAVDAAIVKLIYPGHVALASPGQNLVGTGGLHGSRPGLSGLASSPSPVFRWAIYAGVQNLIMIPARIGAVEMSKVGPGWPLT